MVPFAAGGSTDLVARVIAEKMSADLGQQVIVQNMAGAGGNLGADNVARAEPDGYTVLMGTVATHALNPLILKTKPYDPEKDFAPISLLVVVPNVLVVNPELPVKTVEELVALLKASPDKFSYASSGNGTPLHLSGELFKKMAGVSMQHIPYKGSGPALNDVIGNQVPIMFDNLPSSSGHIKAGTLRALGRDDGGARAVLPRCADNRRIGRSRIRDLYVECALCPGEHASRGRGSPQRGGQEGARRSGGRRADEGIQRHDRRLQPRGTRRPCDGGTRQMDPGGPGRERPDGLTCASDGARFDAIPARRAPR